MKLSVKNVSLMLLKNVQFILRRAKGKQWAVLQEKIMEVQSIIMSMTDFHIDMNPRQMRFKWEF